LPLLKHNGQMHIVDEYPGHEDSVRRVVANAFGRGAEAKLVDDLRLAADLAVSLVAEEAGEICGHVALSTLKAPPRALALGPVSVLRTRQRQGIGSALIRRAIECARDSGYEIIFVLGDPDYYKRFGFQTKEAAPFRAPFSGPYFMALNLMGKPVAPADVIYPHACQALG
jgi:putative acetyltransferase